MIPKHGTKHRQPYMDRKHAVRNTGNHKRIASMPHMTSKAETKEEGSPNRTRLNDGTIDGKRFNWSSQLRTEMQGRGNQRFHQRADKALFNPSTNRFWLPLRTQPIYLITSTPNPSHHRLPTPVVSPCHCHHNHHHAQIITSSPPPLPPFFVTGIKAPISPRHPPHKRIT